jgi:hypothetical protein
VEITYLDLETLTWISFKTFNHDFEGNVRFCGINQHEMALFFAEQKRDEPLELPSAIG